MSRYLYIQDFHLSGKTPENRKDNYLQSILLKLDEILLIAKKNKVDFIIDGGDFFESPLIANTIIDEVLDRIEFAKFRWYMLFGNHCEMGHNIENSKGTSLAHAIRRSKYVNYLNIIEDNNYYLKGFEYEHNCEQKIKEKGLFCKIKGNRWKIAIVHALITVKPLPYRAMHIVAKDIKTDFDVVLVAHNHQQWGIKEINGTKFVSIGCLGRRKIDEKDIKPSVLLVDTKTKGLKIIELKSAKKTEEVFDLKKVEEIKLFEGEITNFINSLSDVKIQGLDIRGMVEYIGKEKNIEQEIIKEVIERIGGFEQ